MTQTIYSQHGEDLAIKRYFKNKKNGSYIDIGAFDPIKYSNTYLFYQQGWSGLNVEPNPDVFDRFLDIRNKDINVNCAVSKSNENLSYYQFNHGAVNTFVKKNSEVWAAKQGFQIKNILEIKAHPLHELLDKHWTMSRPIDFMSVDVEGMDLEGLESNDWNSYRPELLIVEENIYKYDHYSHSDIHQYLLDQNYRLWNITGISLFYVSKD